MITTWTPQEIATASAAAAAALALFADRLDPLTDPSSPHREPDPARLDALYRTGDHLRQASRALQHLAGHYATTTDP